MADPRNELADIMVPAAPEAVVAAVSNSLFLWAALGLVGLAAVALLAWLWQRTRRAAQRQGTPPALAARLDAWARARFHLPRVDAAICPPGLDPVVWSDWAQALTKLRFAPPPPDGYTLLTALCERARPWSRRA
jgi:hypothetical protein